VNAHRLRQVAEPAYPDDTHPTLRPSIPPKRRVDGDAAAQQRCRNFKAERIGNRKRKASVDADAIGEASVAAHTGLDDPCAEVLVAALAPFTLQAAPALPADTDPSAEVEMSDQRPLERDRPHDLVPGNECVISISTSWGPSSTGT